MDTPICDGPCVWWDGQKARDGVTPYADLIIACIASLPPDTARPDACEDDFKCGLIENLEICGGLSAGWNTARMDEQDFQVVGGTLAAGPGINGGPGNGRTATASTASSAPPTARARPYRAGR
ncbi:hypothetical protein [Streptomyces rhizosphaerihabitans]|uniref:hypothetical protein n=1 Tax=Streptomyces rhizosphaerihabitans TaxID=1266770 RepID=UPI0021C12823|nr:hypothetical protein [Streptomyces rhizosphaerihabitans]MCT9005606.1 hypothetical protein [Streptomyces rhizosphaerihabitans]